MDTFFKYFFADVGRIFRSFIDIFAAFFQFVNYLFNFPMRYRLIREYAPNFSVWEWILVVITEIILLAVAVLIVILVIKALRKLFRFRVPVKKYEEMEKQVKSLQRELLRANYEKDRLMNMRLAELGAGQTPPEE
ncbi:MAG: hypothetical protein J6Y26_04630, partial [Lachnospiraceae bacterium]|nr:hypothetical protein [Lachnospiraceae bacterium]